MPLGERVLQWFDRMAFPHREREKKLIIIIIIIIIIIYRGTGKSHYKVVSEPGSSPDWFEV